MSVARTAIAWSLAAAFVAAAPDAHGQASPDSGVDALVYRPAIDGEGIWSIESDRTLAAMDFSYKAETGFGRAPLAVPVPGIGEGAGDEGSDDVLSYVLTFHNMFAFGLTSRLTLGFEAAVYRTDPAAGYGERSRYRPDTESTSTGLISLRPLSNIDPSGGFEPQGLSGPLDARVGGKFRLFGSPTSPFGGALLALIRLPFGNEELFLGDRGLVFEPKIAVGWHARQLAVIGNLGALFRRRTVLEAYDPVATTTSDAAAVLDVGSEVVAGIGVESRVISQLALMGEVNILTPLPASLSYGDCERFDGQPCDSMGKSDYFADQKRGDRTVFGLFGVEYQAGDNIAVRVAGGAGFLGARSDTFQLLAGLTWRPDTSAGARGKDEDRDGVPDVIDLCASEPEDADDFQDEDGCPELDNDGDGVLDANDGCPKEPEDKDGFHDDDGCPEPDNDKDGVLDVIDSCASEPEDKDGFNDEDGCPDQDNDGDSIPDGSDRCPNDPETVNQYADEDGCPDALETGGPTLGSDRIDLAGARIEFKGARSSDLNAGSTALLDQIAELMRREKVQVRVEVHVPRSTTSTKKPQIARAAAEDKRLSSQRARAVLDYLVGRGGVPIADVQAVGLGSARPRGDLPAADPGQARVEFILVRQAPP
ncbi:MAG TPA: OmpA family protein [Kofleriaceae bacterium]|jgi:outer membrane protein OmpA-like peptidoglycan-associated protein